MTQKEIIKFLESLKRIDKYTNIDYTTALIEEYGMSRKNAEMIHREWVFDVFRKIPFTPVKD
jgi:hypothetical protein